MGPGKSRRTHGTWGGAWGPSQSRGQWLLVSVKVLDRNRSSGLGDPVVVGWSNRGWGVGQGGQGAKRAWGHWRSPLCCTRSSGLTRAPGGPANLVDLHPHWAPGVSCGASGPRKTLGTNSIISRNRGGLWFSLAPGSPLGLTSPELPQVTGEPQGGAGSSGGSWGRGPAHSVTVSPATLASSTFSCSVNSTLCCS